MNAAVQQSVTQSAVGLVIGTTIETLMPAHSDGQTMAMRLLETGVQVGLNGLAIMYASQLAGGNDPTGGMMYHVALLSPQCSLQNRFASLTNDFKVVLHPVLSKMVGPA